MPLTATGNEPGWRLDLTAARFTLLADYGDVRVEAPAPQPERLTAGVRHRVHADGHRVEAVVHARRCADTMTGMPYPYTVVLRLDGRELHGCGGDPRTLLTGGAWTVLPGEGAGHEADARSTLHFEADGRLHGTTACNRYAGEYRIGGERTTIEVAAGTSRRCTADRLQAQRRFLDTLAGVYRFEVVGDDTLVLHAPDASITAMR